MSDAAPLILTLTLDAEAFAFFDQLRRQHFPPERNFLAAHVTLFHHLPGEQRTGVVQELAARCQGLPPLPVAVTGLQFLGRGVAYRLSCPPLVRLHRELQELWRPQLKPQDLQLLRPHVTVQNKVQPEQARALLAELSAEFTPFAAVGTGLHLWAYRGGPWESLEQLPFAAPAGSLAVAP